MKTTFEQAVAACARKWIASLMYSGTTPFIVGDATFASIEPDGRKRKVILRQLQHEEYVSPIDSALLSKAYDELVPEDPHLEDRISVGEQMREYTEMPLGINVQNVSNECLKYIIEHPNDFQWAIYYHYLPRKWEPMTMGSKVPQSSSESLAVSSPAYRNRIDYLTREAQVKELLVQQVPWGLCTLDHVTEEQAKLLGLKGHSLSAFPGGFGPDPMKWGDDVQKSIEMMRDQIARLRAGIAAYRAADDSVHENGGWDAFRAAYEARLREELDAEAEVASKEPK